MDTLNLNTLTIVMLAYWAIAALWAGHRGLIRTILSFLVLALTVVITYAATPTVSQTLSGSANLNQFLQDRTSSGIDSLADRVADGETNTGLLNMIPMPEEVKTVMSQGNGDVAAAIIRTEPVRSYVAIQLANVITRILSVILTAIATFVLLTIIRIVLLKIAGLPGISAADHFLGFLLGMIKGIFVIWIALLVIRLIALSGNGTSLMEQVRESEILSLLDYYNVVRRLIVTYITGL